MKKVVLWVFVMVLVVSSVCGFLLSTEQLDLLRTQIYAFNTNPLYVNTGTAVSTYNLGSTPPASERGKQTNDQLANTVLTDLKKNNPQVTWTVVKEGEKATGIQGSYTNAFGETETRLYSGLNPSTTFSTPTSVTVVDTKSKITRTTFYNPDGTEGTTKISYDDNSVQVIDRSGNTLEEQYADTDGNRFIVHYNPSTGEIMYNELQKTGGEKVFFTPDFKNYNTKDNVALDTESKTALDNLDLIKDLSLELEFSFLSGEEDITGEYAVPPSDLSSDERALREKLRSEGLLDVAGQQTDFVVNEFDEALGWTVKTTKDEEFFISKTPGLPNAYTIRQGSNPPYVAKNLQEAVDVLKNPSSKFTGVQGVTRIEPQTVTNPKDILGSAQMKDAVNKAVRDLEKERSKQTDRDARQQITKKINALKKGDPNSADYNKVYETVKATANNKYETYNMFGDTFLIRDKMTADGLQRQVSITKQLAGGGTMQVPITLQQYDQYVKAFSENNGKTFYDERGIRRTSEAYFDENGNMQVRYETDTGGYSRNTEWIKSRIKAFNNEKARVDASRLYSWAKSGQELTNLFGWDDKTVDWAEKLFSNEDVANFMKGKWEDSFCNWFGHVDKPSEIAGVFYDPETNMIMHAEGERSKMEFVNESGEQKQYLYKITFAVNCGSSANQSNNRMKFNLELRGDTNRKLWAEDYMLGGKMPTTNPLQSGVDLPDYIGALGTSAIVEYSNNYYTKICMVYTLYGEWPLESGERCNDLVDTESKLTIAEMNQKQQLPQDVADAVATSDTYIPPTRQSI